MRREGAARRGQFSTSDEYQIDCLTAYPGEILELGRSCVDPTYRSGATMQLLWRGIAEYVFYHDISIMFGRSEEHTSELQSLMRISYAVFCLKKKNKIT